MKSAAGRPRSGGSWPSPAMATHVDVRQYKLENGRNARVLCQIRRNKIWYAGRAINEVTLSNEIGPEISAMQKGGGMAAG